MQQAPANLAERVGVVATDPLRVLGLKAIFRDALQLEIVQLSIPGALDDGNLALVLIDAECTDHLFELIGTFRQVHPSLKLIVLGNETSQDYIERVIGAGAKGYLPLTAQEADIRMAKLLRLGICALARIEAVDRRVTRDVDCPAARTGGVHGKVRQDPRGTGCETSA